MRLSYQLLHSNKNNHNKYEQITIINDLLFKFNFNFNFYFIYITLLTNLIIFYVYIIKYYDQFLGNNY